MKKAFFLVLSFCLSVLLVGCVKQMPEPTKETCSNDYLKKHPDLNRRFLRYQEGLRSDSPNDVVKYLNGCSKFTFNLLSSETHISLDHWH